MKSSICGQRKPLSRKGQGMVEFGGVATVFLLFMFGLMNLGSVVYCFNAVSAAAREASRYAMAHSPTSPSPATSDQIRQVALNFAVGLSPDHVTVTSTWPADSNLPTKKDAKVQVTYQYSLNIPLLKSVTFSLSSTSRVLVSQ